MANHTFQQTLPHFKKIDPASIKLMICHLLDQNRQQLKTVLSQNTLYTFNNLMQPLEEMSDELNKTWSPIVHLHSVMESDALRKAYHETLPFLIDYHTEFAQNETLFNAILSIETSKNFETLTPAQQKIIKNEIRDFKLAGIHLPLDKKLRFGELQKKLSQLTTTFSENVLDATHAFTLHIKDPKKIEGLPEKTRELAEEEAKKRGLEGYLLTLDYPSYSTAMKYVKDQAIRHTLYEAYVTRASEIWPHQKKWDNTEIIENILKIRKEIANLLDFKQYAEYALVPRMANKTEEVLSFLNDLLAKSIPLAKKEYQTICDFAKKEEGITSPEAWDLSYLSEQLREKYFHFTQEDVRPYFPIQKVLNGLFSIANKLFGITLREEKNIETWHEDVHFFSIFNHQNELQGGLYIDLYARPHKRDGAWMDEYCARRLLVNGSVQHPIAYLTCNFMPPVEKQSALLTHDDVLTLFHEFGHCLHHLLTKVNYPSVAGINGVPWDAVEFPSQFMENFCWEKASLDLIAAHYETQKPLPFDLYQKMIRAKYFQSGLQMVRQLEFALFDFRLHMEYDPQKQGQVQSILDEVRKKIAVVPFPPFNRFQHSFSHIFAGGYAAGYYSYKWAEVLSADAYAQFEENGIFDRKTGQSFLENILETGGVRDPMASFVAFRGRMPSIDALLKQNGIIEKS